MRLNASNALKRCTFCCLIMFVCVGLFVLEVCGAAGAYPSAFLIMLQWRKKPRDPDPLFCYMFCLCPAACHFLSHFFYYLHLFSSFQIWSSILRCRWRRFAAVKRKNSALLKFWIFLPVGCRAERRWWPLHIYPMFAQASNCCGRGGVWLRPHRQRGWRWGAGQQVIMNAATKWKMNRYGTECE